MEILLVSSKPLFRIGLRIILEKSGWSVTECSRASEALERFPEADWDLVVSELDLKGPDGVWLTQTIHRQRPAMPVLLVSDYRREHDVVYALKGGASGYITFSSSSGQFQTALGTVVDGAIYVGRTAANSLRTALNQLVPPALPELSESETAILRAVIRGRNNQEIAVSLDLPLSRVKNLLSELFQKFEVSNRTLLATEATRRGLRF